MITSTSKFKKFSKFKRINRKIWNRINWLLSDIIEVQGILCKDENKNYFYEFKVNLDKSKKQSEILAKEIKQSIEILFDIDNKPENFKTRPNFLKNRKKVIMIFVFLIL